MPSPTRVALLTALAAGVTAPGASRAEPGAPPTAAEPAPREERTRSAVKTKAKAKTKTKPRTRAKAAASSTKASKKPGGNRVTARGKARKKTARVTPRATNMPAGWSWPPSREMVAAGTACTRELDELGVGWKPARAARKIGTPITVPAMELGGVKLVSTYRKGPHVMDCQLALGLARHLPALHAAGVRELHFSRIHDYTPVRVDGGVKRGVLSRHALGLAIDVRSFVDAGGRKAVVLDDYPQGDELLLGVEQALTDSGGFRTILTPRNDPASHDDHFHLEVRVDYTRPAPRKPPT